MHRIKPFTKKAGEQNKSENKYTVIIPIASKRKPKPAEGIHDPELARAIESQFYMILPDVPPANASIEPPEK
ncbi:MAG: hypothetical protein ACOX4Q_15515 [Syntrophomonadales bacterium]|jgi:hypothetical protein